MRNARPQNQPSGNPLPGPVPDAGSHDSAREERNARIAASAYYKAEARGFQPGHELEDWLAAEAETEEK